MSFFGVFAVIWRRLDWAEVDFVAVDGELGRGFDCGVGVRSVWAGDARHLRKRCLVVFERINCRTAPATKPVWATSLRRGLPRVFDVPFEFLLADVCRRESNMISELGPYGTIRNGDQRVSIDEVGYRVSSVAI